MKYAPRVTPSRDDTTPGTKPTNTVPRREGISFLRNLLRFQLILASLTAKEVKKKLMN